jgi:tripartite-type tricarboxylate transporter receptor subunit TctC
MTTPSFFSFIHRTRRGMVASALALTMLVGSSAAPLRAQQAFPDRQIRLIVAFAPGGIADVMARMIGQKLSAKFGQTVITENRTGAGGLIAARFVAAAPPDGYTLLVTTTSLAINAVAMKNPVDPLSQLSPIGPIAVAPMIFTAPKSVKDPDLMTFVRNTKKGQFTYSSAGVGTAEHLTAEYLFKVVPGLEGTHVPFSGGAPAVNAAMTSSVDIAAVTVPSALALIQSGDLHMLGVTSPERLKSLPNVPTVKEAGFPDLSTASWIAMFGPPGMPADIVEKLNAEINAALAQPDMRDRLVELGFVVQPKSVEAFKTSLNAELADWRKIVSTIGFAPN